jgi:hypothetical protein
VPLPELGNRPPLHEPALGQGPQADVVEGGYDQVGARPDQQVPVVQPGHPERGHATGLGRLDTA